MDMFARPGTHGVAGRHLVGKGAVITGSTSGIGLGIARGLAAAGANLLLNGFGDAGSIAGLRDRLEREFDVTVAYSGADMSRPDQIETMLAEAVHTLGAVDILVNNAGIQHVAPLESFPPAKWDQILAINLTAAFHTMRLAIPGMSARGWGRIVNIASVAGMRAVGVGRTGYGTSKAAVIGLTRQMAVELAEHGITANAVAPGPVDTPMTRVLHSPQFRKSYTDAIPMNRYGTPEEVAAAVGYLVSDAAAYTTGIVIPVDGGFLASGAR